MNLPHLYQVPEMLIRLHEVFTRMSNISHYYCYDTCTSHVIFNVHETYCLRLSCGAPGHVSMVEQTDDGLIETPISKLYLARYQGKVRKFYEAFRASVFQAAGKADPDTPACRRPDGRA